MNPSVHINLTKYHHNLLYLTNMLEQQGITCMAVTKVFCADQRLVDVINSTDIKYVADSRIKNFIGMKTSKTKVLLRIPHLSEVCEVIKYTDISLNSEVEVIKNLNDEAKKQNKKHRIILMFDIGDLREGIYYKSEYLPMIEQIIELKHIELLGIGTNLTCYGGVIPTKETLDKLEMIKHQIEETFFIHLDVISGGNSSSIKLIEEHQIPSFINNLRIGEAFVLGRETAYGKHIDQMFDDVFTLKAEIIELKDKPSLPEGILGFDAFGKKVSFKDQGEMTRAILGIGRQDIQCEDLVCPKNIKILGCSSDHLILQVKKGQYALGDLITFKLTYGGILSLTTSPYVRRVYES